MSRAAEQVLAALAAEVAGRAKWDEPPGLYFLYLEGGRCHARRIGVPDAVWASDAPPRVLAAMADCFGDHSGLLRAAAPEELHGAGFYCETWTVEQPEAGTAARSEVMADAMAHKIWTRPDRVEARTMWAVDRAGTVYGAILRRGIDAAPRVTATYPKAGRRISGDVPVALERIVTAMLAETMPGRG